MFNASKFYIPRFQTGVPNGKVYTYDKDNNNIFTYKSIDGTLNTNPILLDEKGECVIYIDEENTYKYVIKDSNDVEIYTLENITPAKGEPGPSGGPKGDKGDKGRTGSQGISGGQGVKGDVGNQGAKGLPLLTKIQATNNNTYTLPAGIKEIFVTACAGGGSAANWSPYTAYFAQKDPLNRTFTSTIAVKIGEDEQEVQSTNQYIYPSYFLTALNLTPGSGFAGQSVFKYRIKIDDPTASDNTVQFIIGNGGSKNENITTDLNGRDGTDTKVYVNGVLRLTLLGGKGGKNIFPANNEQVVEFYENWNGKINYNEGYKSNLIYRSTFNGTSGPGNSQPQGYTEEYFSLFNFDTKYYKTSGSIAVLDKVKTSYRIMQFNFNMNSNIGQNKFKTLNNFRKLNGGKTIFENYYTNYGDNKENSFYSFYNTVKGTNNEIGYGAGGDAYISYYKGNNGNEDGSLNIRFIDDSSTGSFTFFDKDNIKDIVINFHLEFRVYNSYNSGTFDIPKKDDTSGYWKKLDNIEANLNSNTLLNVIKNKPVLINKNEFKNVINNTATYGGAGQNGFAFFEYGSITQIDPE